MREIGVMVVPDNNKSIFSKNFKLRVFSTIFILPIPIIIIWNGSWIFVGFLALLSFIALTEWNKLIGIYSANLRSQIPSFLTVCSIIVVAILGYRLGLMTILLACLSSLIISRDERSSVLLSMFGPAYVFLPCCCFLWLREVPVYGLHMVFWLLLVVSTMDICAYLFGRLIKGPKLAPKISPSKTWSGLISGVFCATSVGGFIGHHMFDFQLFLGNWKWAMALALLVSVFAQIGDLGESWLKRQMHVKDSGNLIPGHGGLLDRVDGFMLSAPLMVIFILCLT